MSFFNHEQDGAINYGRLVAVSDGVNIQASDGHDFYRQVATYAYSEFMRKGVGAVVIAEGHFQVFGDGQIEAVLLYVPYTDDSEILPPEAEQQIDAYNPDRECVLALADGNGEGSCLTLTANQMGSSPKTLFEEAIRNQQHVPIVPGTVVKLCNGPDDIEPGFFVFLGEQKSEMVISRAGEDEDGDIVPTDDIHRIHVDYRDAVEATEIRVPIYPN